MSSLPQFPVEGGCVCGAVRYTLTAPPLAVYACHCKDCQRSGSGPFAVGILAQRETFKLNAPEGAVHRFDKTADSGRVVPQFSCAKCSTRIWHEPVNVDDRIIVRAGTLDDAGWAIPATHIWTGNRWPLSPLPAGVPQFAAQLPDRQRLIDAWAAVHPD